MAVVTLAACSGSSSSHSGGSSPTTVAGGSASAAAAHSRVGRLGDDPATTDAGDSAAAAYTPSGPLLADDGFRPAANGFSFENYGDDPANPNAPTHTNLTAADVQQLFGPKVCVNGSGDTCDLSPEAQAWMDSVNGAMAGGHCFGFSVMADLLFQGKLQPSTYGADSVPALKLDGNNPLQSQIALDWAYQTLDAEAAAQITGTPNDILAKLKDALVPNPPETYTIAIFRADGGGGHAVTPYAIEDKGNGIENVLIYDNNWPGVTRAITFDTNANTWHYVAATNPDQASEVYDGDANSKSISLFPSSPGLAVQPCPFCGTATTGSAANSDGGQALHVGSFKRDAPNPDESDEVYLDSSPDDHAHVLITDPQGHKLGYDNGTFVNQIPGADVVKDTSSQSWEEGLEPIYYVPDGVHYDITLDGTGMTEADNEELGVIGPDFELSASDININPGEKDTLGIDPDAEKLTYNASRPETPILELAVSDTAADYTFDVSGESDANSTVTLGLPIDGGVFNIDTGTTEGTTTFDLSMLREDDNGSQEFDHNDMDLNNGDSAQMQFGNWSNGQSIPIVVTHPDGSKETQQIADQDVTDSSD
jgi:hypothetical protein